MHRVLPGCTYGCIPKVQGAPDVHFVRSCASCLGAACAFHQKATLSRGAQTVRQSAPRAVKSHKRVQRSSHVALKPCCGPRGRKRSDTVGELKSAEMWVSNMSSLKVKKLGKLAQEKVLLEL